MSELEQILLKVQNLNLRLSSNLQKRKQMSHLCITCLPRAKGKYQYLVIACPVCTQLFTCTYRRYVPDSVRAGGYYDWKEIKKGNK